MNAGTVGEAVLLAVCIVVAAMASATETALTSVGRFRVRHMVEEGSRAAATLQRLHDDPNRFLSTVLVTNTVALILASFATTLLSIQFVPERYGFLGQLGVSLLLSVFLLIFAEVTPKSLAIRNADRIALWAAGPVNALSRVLRPVLWFITLIARATTIGRAARGPFLTEQELMTLLNVSEQEGVIEEQEREMINQIIEIGDKPVREVMVPRTDITAVDRGASMQEVLDLLEATRHTRLPVHEGDLDSIIGMVHVKDLALLLRDPRPERWDLARLTRPITFTPESKKVDELLHEMQTERVHMKVVLDEYGGTAGLVSIEDLLEEIVGEIRDEYDVAEEEPLRVLSEKEAVVDARYPMDELNEKLDLGVDESEDYDSVGGFVLATLGSIPEAGARFDAGRAHWTVDAVNGNRVLEVRLQSDEPWPDDALVAAGLREPAPREADHPAPDDP
ncbi:MAG: HlyC/CorC family transporter [Candidatus Dormibacteraeota bacterium]|nr:HlyC/CorC family transporter [Candidatus Dormibacteraeota bacterium]MBO0760463.1 HlyC/CorC family transporter [Candidatus Dormibacteraeota bacterium]